MEITRYWVWRFLRPVCMVSLFLVASDRGVMQAAEPQAGTWSCGAAIGFLGNTPDGTAFATNLHADYFFTRQISVGPWHNLR